MSAMTSYDTAFPSTLGLEKIHCLPPLYIQEMRASIFIKRRVTVNFLTAALTRESDIYICLAVDRHAQQRLDEFSEAALYASSHLSTIQRLVLFDQSEQTIPHIFG